MKPHAEYFAAIWGKPKSGRQWTLVRECPLKAGLSLEDCIEVLEACLDDYVSDSTLFDFENKRWKTDWEYKGMIFDVNSDLGDPGITVHASLKRLHDRYVKELIKEAERSLDYKEAARLRRKYSR